MEYDHVAVDAMAPDKSPAISLFQTAIHGALSGFIATIPMTIFMGIGRLFLPKFEKYPLPPRQITGRIAERLGLKRPLSNTKEITVATAAAHLGYGALAGSIYALLFQKIPIDRSLKGIVGGLIVWATSYMGWLPAFSILKPATQHPWPRELLMIIAHLIWGTTTSNVASQLKSKTQPLSIYSPGS